MPCENCESLTRRIDDLKQHERRTTAAMDVVKDLDLRLRNALIGGDA